MGLHELAAQRDFIARLTSPHPNPPLLHVGEGVVLRTYIVPVIIQSRAAPRIGEIAQFC